MTTERKPSCRALRNDGSPCQTVFGLSPDNFCFPHDPQRAVEWQAMQRNRADLSAKRRKEMRESIPAGVPRAPKTLEDALQWASWSTHAVACKVIDARTAHEIAVLVREFRMTLEKRDLAKEIDRLKDQIADLKKKPARVA